eukprot:295364-Rhodomonas_salina.1
MLLPGKPLFDYASKDPKVVLIYSPSWYKICTERAFVLRSTGGRSHGRPGTIQYRAVLWYHRMCGTNLGYGTNAGLWCCQRSVYRPTTRPRTPLLYHAEAGTLRPPRTRLLLPPSLSSLSPSFRLGAAFVAVFLGPNVAVLCCRCEIKYKKPRFQCNSYQECGFVYLISQCTHASIPHSVSVSVAVAVAVS